MPDPGLILSRRQACAASVPEQITRGGEAYRAGGRLSAGPGRGVSENPGSWVSRGSYVTAALTKEQTQQKQCCTDDRGKGFHGPHSVSERLDLLGVGPGIIRSSGLLAGFLP